MGDFAQIMERSEEDKERASVEELVAVLARVSSSPKIELLEFFRRLLNVRASMSNEKVESLLSFNKKQNQIERKDFELLAELIKLSPKLILRGSRRGESMVGTA